MHEAHRTGLGTRWASRSGGSFDPPYDRLRLGRVRISSRGYCLNDHWPSPRLGLGEAANTIHGITFSNTF